jgi:methyl-accepting chemotaxis protein
VRQNKEDDRALDRERHQREISERYAKAIETISDSTEETSKAVRIIADHSEQMHREMEQIDRRLEGVEKRLDTMGKQ